MWGAGSQSYWNVRGARLLENVISLCAASLYLLAAILHVALVELRPCAEPGAQQLCEPGPAAGWLSGAEKQWAGLPGAATECLPACGAKCQPDQPGSPGCPLPLWIVPSLQAIASLVAWGYLFFTLLGIKGVGRFVVMLWEMLLNDIWFYMHVFLVILIGFMQAIWALMMPNFRSMHTVQGLFTHLTHAMIGNIENLEKFGQADQSEEFAIRATKDKLVSWESSRTAEGGEEPFSFCQVTSSPPSMAFSAPLLTVSPVSSASRCWWR